MKWLTFIHKDQGMIFDMHLTEKMERMGWTPKSAYEQLEHTIKWTLDNNQWLKI